MQVSLKPYATGAVFGLSAGQRCAERGQLCTLHKRSGAISCRLTLIAVVVRLLRWAERSSSGRRLREVAAAEPGSNTSGMRPTLGLTGVTVNAMALIAPGAFLWITFQLQAAQTFPGGSTSTALDMWPGIVFALILAFLTAISYSELAKIYPEAGSGSCYYFAEKAFVDKEELAHQRWGRIAKLVTGWAAHLFYWVYPGVMVSFMAILIAYIAGLFGVTIDAIGQIIIAVVFSILVGYIAFRGINGSTLTAIIINVIQLTALVGFAVLAIAYRVLNPDHATFVHSSITSVILPHSLMGILFQSTIA